MRISWKSDWEYHFTQWKNHWTKGSIPMLLGVEKTNE